MHVSSSNSYKFCLIRVSLHLYCDCTSLTVLFHSSGFVWSKVNNFTSSWLINQRMFKKTGSTTEKLQKQQALEQLKMKTASGVVCAHPAPTLTPPPCRLSWLQVWADVFCFFLGCWFHLLVIKEYNTLLFKLKMKENIKVKKKINNSLASMLCLCCSFATQVHILWSTDGCCKWSAEHESGSWDCSQQQLPAWKNAARTEQVQ